ncbi:PilZ domain-containing protein [Photobacterium arenosum]|uniref:PilZ domain-containing protein n=1 Tax=Photobacterium arenosum TaxID=2774143 RepID=UPI00288BFCC3|nr:PilZ domain-containing protein [Photobacterium arenosum]
MLLDEYKGLIEQLLPAYDSGDFNDLFQHLTADLSGPVRLQVKMEINRLMAPCRQPVDLRGKVSGECRPYDMHGMTHWLDDVAMNVYRRRIKTYGEQYRVGLFESLMNTRNNFRVMQQQDTQAPPPEEPAEALPFGAELLRFGYHLSRSEQRIQITTPVVLTLPYSQEVNGTTSDISPSGARFRVSSAFRYHTGQVVTAFFPELAKQLKDERLVQGISYRILGVSPHADNDSYIWLRLMMIESSDALKEAIEARQKMAASRSRQNHEDKIIQSRTRGYEHSFLKHTSSIPLFFAGNELKYCLQTEHNRHLWEHWHDERNQSVINHLLSEDRIRTLGQEGLSQGSTLIYSFTHQHEGKTYFYSAALPEMSVEERQLFWQIGATRESWRVVRLTLYPISQDDKIQLQEIAPELLETLSSLTHIGVLQNLTNKDGQHDYRLTEKPALPSKYLHTFRHPRNPVSGSRAIYFDPKPQRSESRFLFRTPVSLSQPTAADKEASILSGTSIDVSTRGLNIRLTEPLDAKRGDVLKVTFDELLKMAKDAPLKRIPYQVVRLSPDRRNVQLETGRGDDATRSEHFLRRLIKHNEERLPVSEEIMPAGPLLQAMHQMLLTRLNCLPFFCEKIDNQVKVRALGANQPLPALGKLMMELGDGKQINLAPIFQNRVKALLSEPMRPITVSEPYVHEMYLAVLPQPLGQPKVLSKLFSDFPTGDTRRRFAQQAREQGHFLAVRITTVPMLDPTTALISRELAELSRLAMHRARALENEFTSLMGFGEFYDVTDEVLLRLGL